MDFRRPASEFPNDNLDLHDGAVWRCRDVTGASRAIVRPPVVTAVREAAPPVPVEETVSVAEIIAEAVDQSVAEIVAETGAFSDALPREADPEVVAQAVNDGIEEIIGQAEREAVAEFIAEAMDESVAEFIPEAANEGEADESAAVVDVADERRGSDRTAEEIADAGSEGSVPVEDPEPVSAVESVLEAPSNEVRACEEDDSAPLAFEALLSTLSEVALARGATRAAAVIGDLLRAGSTQADLVSKAGIDAGESAGLLVKRGKRLELSAATREVARAWRAALDGSGDLTQIGNSTLDGFCSELLATISADTDSLQQIRRELRSRGVAAFGLLEVAA